MSERRLVMIRERTFSSKTMCHSVCVKFIHFKIRHYFFLFKEETAVGNMGLFSTWPVHFGATRSPLQQSAIIENEF